MPSDVFISHSLNDKATAEAVCAKLEAARVRCWIAPRDIRPGADWAESIIAALGSCKVMVLIFSSHADASSQVRREVQRAFERGLTVMPFRIEDVSPSASLEYYIGSVHWLDALTNPMERHIDKLVFLVKSLTDAATRVPEPVPPAEVQKIPEPQIDQRESETRPLQHKLNDPNVIGTSKKAAPKQRQRPGIFALVALVIAGIVAGWWLGIERTGPEAKKQAAIANAGEERPGGNASDSTVPQEKNSQPPYWTHLRLERSIPQPFRLIFNAYDGDVQKPDSLEFQINAIDVHQPSQFVKIGDVINGTKFKVMRFEYKGVLNPPSDASELTVQNTETGEDIILKLQKIADCRDAYAVFRYLWNNTEFRVTKGQQFSIPPETSLQYRLIDVGPGGAAIKTSAGQVLMVPLLQN